jgi:hypothetical protein
MHAQLLHMGLNKNKCIQKVVITLQIYKIVLIFNNVEKRILFMGKNTYKNLKTIF